MIRQTLANSLGNGHLHKGKVQIWKGNWELRIDREVSLKGANNHTLSIIYLNEKYISGKS